MPSSLFIGLIIVFVGIVAARFTMFETRGGHAAEPAASGTLPASGTTLSDDTVGNDRTTASALRRLPSTGLRAAMGVRRPTQRPSVKLRWYQRVRSGLLLVLITIGFGMAIGGALGGAALLVSFLLG